MFNMNGTKYRAIAPAELDAEEADGRFYLISTEQTEENVTFDVIKFGLDSNPDPIDITEDGYFAGRLTIEPMGCFPWLGCVARRTLTNFL